MRAIHLTGWMEPLYTYRAYSLCIRSEIPLPALEAEVNEIAPNVAVKLGRVDRFPEGVDQPCRSAAERAFLYWIGVGKFLVQRGCEITVDPLGDPEDSVLQEYLLGPVLAMLMYQRGLFVLHASTIAVNGKAVLFLGKSGLGKSTMAAALYARGHSIVSDDITAVQFAQSGPMVLPGIPRLRLFPDALMALEVPSEAVAATQHLGKTTYCADRGRQRSSLPVERIYVLAEGLSHESQRLSQRDAVAMLAGHSYVTNAIEATGTTTSHFHECVHLAQRIPAYHLRRKWSLAGIADLAELVEEEITRSSP